MPAFAVKRGSRKPNRPDCSVDVVDATMIEPCANAAQWIISPKIIASVGNRCFIAQRTLRQAGGVALAGGFRQSFDDRYWPISESTAAGRGGGFLG
jgi:hypothetical protein